MHEMNCADTEIDMCSDISSVFLARLEDTSLRQKNRVRHDCEAWQRQPYGHAHSTLLVEKNVSNSGPHISLDCSSPEGECRQSCDHLLSIYLRLAGTYPGAP